MFYLSCEEALRLNPKYSGAELPQNIGSLLTWCNVTAPIGLGIGYIDAFGGFDFVYDMADESQMIMKEMSIVPIPLPCYPYGLPALREGEY